MRKNDQHIKDVLKQLESNSVLGKRLKEEKILQVWQDYAGDYISRQTHRLQYQNGILTIYVLSSTLRNELFVTKEKIKMEMNKLLGKDFIQEVQVR